MTSTKYAKMKQKSKFQTIHSCPNLTTIDGRTKNNNKQNKNICCARNKEEKPCQLSSSCNKNGESVN